MPKTKKIFITKNFVALNECKSRIVVNVGGAGSSKSHSTAQLLLHKFNNEKNKNFLVARKTLPALRMTAYKLFINLAVQYERYELFEHNKSERTLINPFNNNYMLFTSVDDPQKFQSTEFNYIWPEEAIEFDWEDFNILNLRMRAKSGDDNPNQMFLTLNPSDEHSWIKEKLIHLPDVSVIHSTYKDNPFLPPEAVREMEKLADIDEYFYKVFTLGEWASATNLIYPNWQLVDSIPNNLEPIYGLDFGYNNPTALTKLAYDGKNIFVQELLYEQHLDFGALRDKLNQLMPNKKKYLYADPEDPRIIEALYRDGFNIHKANKEVYAGLMFCKQFPLLVTSDSINTHKELKSYKWKTDKNGNALDEPTKFMDHIMDTIRYAVYTHGQKYWTNRDIIIPKKTNKRRKLSITAGF